MMIETFGGFRNPFGLTQEMLSEFHGAKFKGIHFSQFHHEDLRLEFIGSTWMKGGFVYILLKNDDEFISLYPFRGGKSVYDVYNPGVDTRCIDYVSIGLIEKNGFDKVNISHGYLTNFEGMYIPKNRF